MKNKCKHPQSVSNNMDYQEQQQETTPQSATMKQIFERLQASIDIMNDRISTLEHQVTKNTTMFNRYHDAISFLKVINLLSNKKYRTISLLPLAELEGKFIKAMMQQALLAVQQVDDTADEDDEENVTTSSSSKRSKAMKVVVEALDAHNNNFTFKKFGLNEQ